MPASVSSILNLIEYWICLTVVVNVEGVCELSESYSVE